MKACRKCESVVADELVVELGRCPGCGGLLFDKDDKDPLIGKELDRRFLIQSRIGAGGMGTVYLAWQFAVERHVAIKVLSPYYVSRSKAVRRFVKEAKAASRLNHPNIVTLYDFGQAPEGYLYIAMELLVGRPLTEVLGRGPLRLDRAAHILLRVCTALVEAHDKGVVHCDLKPDNIFLVRRGDQAEAVKVLDFGIAKLITGDGAGSGALATREVCGTPDYMSPERILGRKVGPETDLYSVGIMLYEMLAGERPHRADAPMAVCLKHLNDEPAPLPLRLPADGRSAAGAQALIDRLLVKDPNARVRTATELIEELQRLAAPLVGPGAMPGPNAMPTLLLPDAVPTVIDPEDGAAVPIRPGLAVSAVETQTRCERCGSFNPGHCRFCGQCGAAMGEPLRCETCGLLFPEGSAFCTRCGGRLPSAATPTRIGLADEGPKPHPISSTREVRRPVTVVHAVATYDPQRAAVVDLEDRLDALVPLTRRWSAEVRKLGGILYGDLHEGLRAVFGAPVAREEDSLLAVRCAIRLREVFGEVQRATDLPVIFRCGVAAGVAIVGAGGSDGVTLVGDVLPEAASLASEAPPGEVVCNEALYREVRESMWASPEGDDGEDTEPDGVDFWLVRNLRDLDVSEGPRVVEGVTPRMIGRDTELVDLQGKMLTAVHNRVPHLVTITGPSGVGKSRLINELESWVRATLPETQILRGRAMRYGEQPPYFLIRDAIAVAAGIREELPGDEATALLEAFARSFVEDTELANEDAHLTGMLLGIPKAAPVGAPEGGQLRQLGFQAVTRLFTAMAEQRPVLLVLEQANAADSASLDLVAHLVESLVDTPLLVVCGARPELYQSRPYWGVEKGAYSRLDLGPLSRPLAVRLADELLQLAPVLPPHVRDFIVDRSEGVPYFMEELVKVLFQRGILHKAADGAWQVEPGRLMEQGVPRSIQGLLQARIDSLDNDEQTVLSAAAVVGRTFWRGAVEHLVGAVVGRPVRDCLRSLRRRSFILKRGGGLFAGDTEYQFESSLLRDVAYERLLRRVRRRAHADIAAWLSQTTGMHHGDISPLLGYHYEEGGELAVAFRHYRDAGRRAMSVFANEEAVRYLRKAIAVSAKAGEEGRGLALAALHEDLGDVLLHTSRHGEARRELLAALAASGSSLTLRKRADLHRKIGKTYYLAQELDLGLKMLKGALEAAGKAPSPVAMAIRAEIGWVQYLLGDHAEAEAQLQQGIELADQVVRPSDPEHAQERLEWVRSLANLHSSLGTVRLARGDRGGAVDLYAKARDLFAGAGLRTNAAACDMNIGVARLAQGRPDEAAEALEQALEAFTALGHRYGIAAARNNLGRAHHRLGHPILAEAHLVAGRAVGEELGASVRVAEACTWLAELFLAEDQLDRALVEARRGHEEAERSHVGEVRGIAARVLGQTLVAAGRWAEAARHLEAAVVHLEALGQVEELALAYEALGGFRMTRPSPPVSTDGAVLSGEALLERARALRERLDESMKPAPHNAARAD